MRTNLKLIVNDAVSPTTQQRHAASWTLVGDHESMSIDIRSSAEHGSFFFRRKLGLGLPFHGAELEHANHVGDFANERASVVDALHANSS